MGRTTGAWLVVAVAGWVLATGTPTPTAADPVPEAEAGSVSRDSLIAEAVERSEELAALRQRISAAEEMASAARALPDPMASVGLANIPVGAGIELDQDMMSGVEVMLSQELPGAEKRRLRGQVQTDMAEMLRARYRDHVNNLTRMVTKSYVDIQYLDAATAVAEQNKLVAADMLAAAEARYATGRGMLQDVFRAQVRESEMLNTLVELRQRRAEAATRLNKLRYRAPAEPVPALSPLARTDIPLDADALTGHALEVNPKLQEMRARLHQETTRADLAAQGLRPDYSLGFRYMVRSRVEMNPMSGTDMWSASVGMNLPWVYRRQSVDREVAAARAEQRAAEHDVAVMENELRQMIAETLIEIARADEQIALVETALLPQAEGALASSRAAYATGKLEFANLLDNQMSLYNEQVRRIALLADRERSIADLEYLAAGLSPSAEAGRETRVEAN